MVVREGDYLYAYWPRLNKLAFLMFLNQISNVKNVHRPYSYQIADWTFCRLIRDAWLSTTGKLNYDDTNQVREDATVPKLHCWMHVHAGIFYRYLL